MSNIKSHCFISVFGRLRICGRRSSLESSSDYVEVVRVVSFSVVLHVLFEIEPSELNLDEARRATEAINRLWIRSKECHSIPSLYDQRVLNNALEILLPNKFPCDDRTHPLNLIIPAYETLWRVVLLTFVAIASRNLDSRITEELEDAIKSVPQCFCLGNDSEMRALAIAKVSLLQS